MIQPAEFKQGMRRLVSGVSIITTIEGGVPYGFVATAVTSVSADPIPTLLICVNKTVSCHDSIMRSGIFCVNLLAEDDIDVAKTFSSPHLREQRFANIKWETQTTGAPAISSAIANFDCTVSSKLEVGTHTIFIASIVDIKTRGSVRPLVYANGQFESLRATLPGMDASSDICARIGKRT